MKNALVVALVAVTAQACSSDSSLSSGKTKVVRCLEDLHLCVDDAVILLLERGTTVEGTILDIVRAGALSADEQAELADMRSRDSGLAQQTEERYLARARFYGMRIFMSGGVLPNELFKRDFDNLFLKSGCASLRDVCVGKTYHYTDIERRESSVSIVDFRTLGISYSSNRILGDFTVGGRYILMAISPSGLSPTVPN